MQDRSNSQIATIINSFHSIDNLQQLVVRCMANASSLAFPLEINLNYHHKPVHVRSSFVSKIYIVLQNRIRRGRDSMVVGFTTSYAISGYQHLFMS